MWRAALLLLISLPLTLLAQPAPTQPASRPATWSLLPMPYMVTTNFEPLTPCALKADTRILVFPSPADPDAKRLRPLADMLAAEIKSTTGLALKVETGPDTLEVLQSTATDIHLSQHFPYLNPGPEDYHLLVIHSVVSIEADTPAGLFYGTRTLLQLLSPTGIIPAVTIDDSPRFPYRSYMLDVARHFRDKTYVLRTLDVLASLKMNTLHLHLTDDQGWRIEIKKYPKLTDVGAWRTENGKRYGGFYTQDDIKEIVAYAAARFITVVPEIEMPGHCMAALAAYPELACTPGPFKVGERWGVYDDVYNPGDDAVFIFNENVLTEVMDLFPSKVIHIGGDEVPKTRWQASPQCQQRIKDEHLKDEHELQAYFIKRIDTFLAAHGRQTRGWDEILDGGLPASISVQAWRGMDIAATAAKAGHDVVCSPTSHCYLDYALSSISLEKAYGFEPVPPKLTAEEAKHILGVEGCMWSEHTPADADVDRQTFPRLCALAEVAWSPAKSRDFAGFSARLPAQITRLRALGVIIPAPSIAIGRWSPAEMSIQLKDLDFPFTPQNPGTYTVTTTYTKGLHGLAIESVALLQDGKEITRDQHPGFAGGTNRQNTYTLKIPALTAGAAYVLRIHCRSDGGTDSAGTINVTAP